MSVHELLTTSIETLRRQRPFARVLVLEASYDDVPVTIEWLRRAINVGAGDGDTSPILVLPPKVYTQRRRRLGPVDVVFVHNQHNIARVNNAPGYVTAMRHLQAQHQPCDIHVIEPSPILGVALARGATWPCGEPYRMSTAPMRIGIPSVAGEPCGHQNPLGTWFCENCGIFRGLSYGD